MTSLAPSAPWRATFASPPALLRPMPLWVWNGDIQEARITVMLEQFRDRGVGGVFIHARPGLITEYLSERWFELWGFALKECQRLGLECHIYDENSYPSGFGGGHVVAEDPLAVGTVLRARLIISPSSYGPAPLAAFRRGPDGRPERVSFHRLNNASPHEPIMALAFERAPADLWHAGFPFVDLCRREVTERFLATTHERYAARFGEAFGSTVKCVFADEPEVVHGDGIHLSRAYLAEFFREHGYDLIDALDRLVFDEPGCEAVRFDYHKTLNRLFVTNFARVCHDWCEAHQLAFTGHYNEHQWPNPVGLPAVMPALRWMQIPGNDLLGFQFKPDGWSHNGLFFLNLKELASVANQLGRQRVLTESCGGGGYGMGIREFKPLEDFLLASGVNLMNPHLSHITLAGARKWDWPQSLSDHSPWWPYYRNHADHVARVAAITTAGPERNRVLVLHPTTSAWLIARPRQFHWPDEPMTDRFEPLRTGQIGLLRALADRQIDFDLGDETLLEELGAIESNALRIGQRHYDLVVLPACMDNWTRPTLDRMEAYLEAGGILLAEGVPPRWVDGRPSDAPAALAARFPDQWRAVPGTCALVNAAAAAVPPRLDSPDGAPLPVGLCWRRVELPEAVAYFFANPWPEPWTARIRLEGKSIETLDTGSGHSEALASEPDGDRVVATLALPAFGHALWVVHPTAPALPQPAVTTAEPFAEIALTFQSAHALDENVVLLDYCDVEVEGRSWRGINTIHADRWIWWSHGLERNLWDRTIQFKQTFLNRRWNEGSGFVARFHFDVSDEACRNGASHCRLAVERAGLFQIFVNDTLVPFADAPRWFDDEIRAAPIGHAVRPGRNEIRLQVSPFHPLCELMPVFLIGPFGVTPIEEGFRLERQATLAIGDWTQQGLPFYPGAVRYQFQFESAHDADRLQLQLADWSGSVLAIRCDGQPVGAVFHPPFRLGWNGGLPPGVHTLDIDVVGNLKNMLGPHFSDGLPGSWSWGSCPDQTPAGASYRFYPSGLLATPRLSIQ